MGYGIRCGSPSHNVVSASSTGESSDRGHGAGLDSLLLGALTGGAR